MEYTFGHEHKEGIRSDEVLNAIVNNAVQEVIDAFGDEMTARDKSLLASVIAEKHTPPGGRVVYLTQLDNAFGATSEIKEYVRQVFTTLQQELTTKEQDLLTPPLSSRPIFEIY
jgi:hypothetical protein